MIMIIEDYCSFEIAMLLKEKGFDAEIKTYWCNDGIDPYFEFIPEPTKHDISNSDGYKYPKDLTGEFACIAPTLQIAMKWLREVHNLFIAFELDFSDGAYPMFDAVVYNLATCEKYPIINYDRYNYIKGTEAAIKYCLENLI